MDTKLKKFNTSILFKFIALILCLATVGVSVCYGAMEFVTIKRNDLQGEHFYDALYNTNNKNIALTQAFQREANMYMGKVAKLVAYYGNGSQKAYEDLIESYENQNSKTIERAKKNLISSLTQREGFSNYLSALSAGDIESCGYIEYTGSVTPANTLYSDDCNGEENMDYAYLASENFSDGDIPYEFTVTDDVSELYEKTKADGIVFITGAQDIVDVYDEENIITTYQPGYYLFKVNESTFTNHLVKHATLESTYSSYEEFRKAFDTLRAEIKESYPSGRYFIRDIKGNTYTNIQSLSKDSERKDIEKFFSGLGFYCKGGNDYNMVLPDGREYNASFSEAIDGAIFDEGTVNYYSDYPVMETTTLPSTTLPDTTLPTTTLPEATAVTDIAVPTKATEPTTYKVEYGSDITKINEDVSATSVEVVLPSPNKTERIYNGKSPFIIATENSKDMTLFFGVDYEDPAYADMDCRFGKVRSDIYSAFNITKALVIVGGTMGILFLACFVFLILRSGRRFGDKENVYMLPFDNMFTDFRILLDCGIIFLIGLFGIWILEEFYFSADMNVNEMLILLTGAIGSAIMFFLLDIILFSVRNIRNKTFAKRLFLIWCISKLSEKSGKALKIKNKFLGLLIILFIPVNFLFCILIYDFCDHELEMLFYLVLMLTYDSLTVILLIKEKNWIEPLKKKLQYVRGFEKETIIKGGIILGINLIGIISGSIEMVRNSSIVIAIILGIFDLFVLFQVIRFIAGIKKIFSAVNELKEGNYSVQIDLYALPHSLHEPANRIMSLRDGLKIAVEEAVKQEQTKTELITNVSHDLKTPLTSVINYVDLLKKCDITDDTAKEYLTVLGEKSDRLKKLIEDLVEASKASTGNIKLNLVEVSLNEILNQITGEFSDAFEKRGLTLISDIPEESFTLRTDSKSLYRILENLMGNVTKYAMENTRVYLSLSDVYGKSVISIKNISASPLNITAEQLKARFVRGDEARSSDGSGLGLSIAESLCNVLGGKLELEINGDLFVAKVEL